MGFFSSLTGKASAISADEAKKEVNNLLIADEKILVAYEFFRDVIIFTNIRLISLDKRGITGSKRITKSVRYNAISSFSLEVTGMLDSSVNLTICVGSEKLTYKLSSDTDSAQLYQELANIIR